MTDGVEFKLQGLEAAERALNELAADMRRRVVIAALRDAARPFVAEARKFAPVLKTASPRRQPGTMRRSINTFRSKRYKPAQGAIGVYVTVRATRARLKKAPISGDPFYWRWVEGGHKLVPRTAKGLTPKQLRRLGQSITERRRGATRSVRPYPFLGPAWTNKQSAALQIFERRVFERIEKANQANP